MPDCFHLMVQKLFCFHLGIPNACRGNGMNTLYSIRRDLFSIIIYNNDIVIVTDNDCAIILGIVTNNNLVPTTWRRGTFFLLLRWLWFHLRLFRL